MKLEKLLQSAKFWIELPPIVEAEQKILSEPALCMIKKSTLDESSFGDFVKTVTHMDFENGKLIYDYDNTHKGLEVDLDLNFFDKYYIFNPTKEDYHPRVSQTVDETTIKANEIEDRSRKLYEHYWSKKLQDLNQGTSKVKTRIRPRLFRHGFWYGSSVLVYLVWSILNMESNPHDHEKKVLVPPVYKQYRQIKKQKIQKAIDTITKSHNEIQHLKSLFGNEPKSLFENEPIYILEKREKTGYDDNTYSNWKLSGFNKLEWGKGRASYKATNSGTGDSIHIDNPPAGVYYIQVYGHEAYSDGSLKATYPPAVTPTPTPEPGVTALENGVAVTISGSRKSEKHYKITVPSGSTCILNSSH